MNETANRTGLPVPPYWKGWSSLWRGALLTLGITFALSTQLLFQFELYEDWALSDILAGWLDQFTDQLLVGSCVFVGVALAAWMPLRSQLARSLLLVAAIALGALAGEAWLLQLAPAAPGVSLASVLATRVARWLVIAALAYLLYAYHQQGAQAASQAHATELQRLQIDRQMAEARLQSLRAQIEPHFLFNTLANVQQLYRTEPERGRRMLGNFVAYLRIALPRMRHDETTLREEVDLARAYLEVLQVRMGQRLQVRIDVPEQLAAMPFPPLALSTLTENAIKHGLNLLPEGGSIEIAAWAEEGRLKVSVADTGAGLRHTGGSGAGLANLRARLAALYGDAGTLQFEANAPRGIRATIALPLRESTGTGG
jgi:hypothetical protein